MYARSANHALWLQHIFTCAVVRAQVPCRAILSPLLHAYPKACNIHDDSCQRKPVAWATCAGSTEKLPADHTLMPVPIREAPRLGFEVTDSHNARTMLCSPHASSHVSQSCISYTISNTLIPTMQHTHSPSVTGSVSSISMLSMNAFSSSAHSLAEQSACTSGAATPEVPVLENTVQGGAVDIPEGVSMDIEGSFVFDTVHFRGAVTFLLWYPGCKIGCFYLLHLSPKWYL
jgi:hypothetical protein